MSVEFIDAHQHFWDPSRGDYGWLTPELSGLYRVFGPDDLKPLREAANVARTVVVQGGAYGEHRIESVDTGGKTFPVNGRSFTVRLAAGAGARLVLRMRRYSERPTELFPEGVNL